MTLVLQIAAGICLAAFVLVIALPVLAFALAAACRSFEEKIAELRRRSREASRLPW